MTSAISTLVALNALDDHARRVREARWLQPDAAMEALGDEALTWIRDRVDEHLAALSPFADDVIFDAHVTTTRDADEAAERWQSAWIAAQSSTPYLAALEAAASVIYAPEHTTRSFNDATVAMDRVASEVSPCAAWQRVGGEGALPIVACAELHAAWLVLYGDARPSPWAPLCALWERGLWPVAMPDATMLVYVPLHVGGVIVPTPGKHAARQPRSAVFVAALPRLQALGCGPAPGAAPVIPTAPVNVPVPVPPPFDYSTMPLAGVAMPVNPLPVVDPLPPPEPEAWYKRLFRFGR